MDAVDLARPARLASVAKIAASAGYLGALFTVADAYPMLYGGFIFVPLAGLTVVRHLRVLTLRPRLSASATQLEVRVWTARFLVPWVFEEARTVPWSELTGATVHTLRVNGIDSSSLVLACVGGSIELEPGVFAEGAPELQRRILDHQARRGVTRAPEQRAAAARARFSEPIVVRSRYTLMPATAALAAAGLVAAIGDMGGLPWFLSLSFAALPLLFALGMVGRFIGERRVRHVELRAEGLAVGPSPAQLRHIPWEEIVYARLASTNGVVHSLRIATRAGREVVLHGKYNYGLAELRELIDPGGG